MAAGVPHDEAIGPGEHWYLRLPFSGITSYAICEHQWKASAMAFIIDVDAVYLSRGHVYLLQSVRFSGTDVPGGVSDTVVAKARINNVKLSLLHQFLLHPG